MLLHSEVSPHWQARQGSGHDSHQNALPTYLLRAPTARLRAPPTYLLRGPLGRSKPDLPTYCIAIGSNRGEQTPYLGRSRNPGVGGVACCRPLFFESAFVVNSTNPMVLCERSFVAVAHTHTPRRTARPPTAPPRRERDEEMGQQRRSTSTYGRVQLCATLPGVSHFPGQPRPFEAGE